MRHKKRFWIILAAAATFIAVALLASFLFLRYWGMPKFVSSEAETEFAYAQFLSERRTGTEAYALREGRLVGEDLLPLESRAPGTDRVAFVEERAGVPVVQLRQGSAVETIGPGVAPFFLSDTLLGRIAPEGIVYTDLLSREERTVFAHAFDLVSVESAVSPNSGLVAWADGPGAPITVVIPAEAGLTKVTTYDQAYTAFGLGNRALYLIHASSSETSVYRRSFSRAKEDTLLMRAPGYLRITGLRFNPR